MSKQKGKLISKPETLIGRCKEVLRAVILAVAVNDVVRSYLLRATYSKQKVGSLKDPFWVCLESM